MEKNGGGLEKDERTILGIVAAFPGADGRVNFGLAAIQSHGLLDLPPQPFGQSMRPDIILPGEFYSPLTV